MSQEPESPKVYYYKSEYIPKTPPKRIVSLVPSMTETIFELGFGAHVVGVTTACLYPTDALANKYKVGAPDEINIEDVVGLRPDLVIINREENPPEQVKALESAGLTVWKTFPRTVMDAMNLIWDTLHLFMVNDRMLYEKVNLIHRTVDWVGGVSEAHEDKVCRVFMPLLPDPLVTVGADTYAHDLLRVAGGTNVFATHAVTPTSPDPALDTSRYPVVSAEQIEAAQPEIVLLPSAPLLFTQADVEWFMSLDIPAAKQGQVYLLDGSLVTYHGVRLARALNEISSLMCHVDEES